MIIFYNKQTGKIEGTIESRITSEDHLNMWIGDRNETERIIINWKPVRYYDKEGNPTEVEADKFAADFEPDHPQRELFVELDVNKSKIRDYKVDLETKNLIPKE